MLYVAWIYRISRIYWIELLIHYEISQLTGALTHAVYFHDRDVETHEELQRLFHDGRRSADEQPASIEAERLADISEDEVVGDVETHALSGTSVNITNQLFC